MAGGLGSRFGGRTKAMPKGFIEIDGIAMVERSVQKLIAAGVEEIIIGTGHCYEYYDGLAEKYHCIRTVRNENYQNTSSMGTLEVCAPFVKDTALLLESDLLYDSIGLFALDNDSRKNVILASGKTNSEDEVYLETDENGVLSGVSKNKAEIRNVAGELVGISKVSKEFLNKMVDFYSSTRTENAKIDYETVFKKIAKDDPIYVHKIEYYAWTEIDDEAMLTRANTLIYPRIKENEELKADKGILAKLQIFLQKTAEKFTGMEHSAEEKSKSLRDSYEERKSVKSDLKRLKAESKVKDAPKITEQAR